MLGERRGVSMRWLLAVAVAGALVGGLTGCAEDLGSQADNPSEPTGGNPTPPPVDVDVDVDDSGPPGAEPDTGAGDARDSGTDSGRDAAMDAGVACGSMSCAVGEECLEGTCRAPCDAEEDCATGSCCSDYCVDTDTDRDHCGRCGEGCPANLACEEGRCRMAMCAGEPGTPVIADAGTDAATPRDAGGDADVSFDVDAGVDAGLFGDSGCPSNEVCADTGDGPACQCGDGAGCPPDQDCQAGECRCGSMAGCEPGERCCRDGCTDLETDESNCGFCGRQCHSAYACIAGDCTCEQAGETRCGESCVDLQADENNCGACGEVCANGATCKAGACECDGSGEIVCGDACVAADSNDNCGACGNACAGPASCRDPSGVLPLDCYCPNVNDVPCDGACVSLGSAQHCGACNDTCGAPADVCRGGSCQCPVDGETACGDQCVDLDAGRDIDTSPDATLFADCGACGVTCMADTTCSGGLCACPGGSSVDRYCDADPVTGATDGAFMCIDVDTTKNCGECGRACLDDSVCRGSGSADAPGDYACECVGGDLGKTHCDGVGCRDLDADQGHCGECGKACPNGIACTQGECACPGADSVDACLVGDEPQCVDTDTDVTHCGACGNACERGYECCNGACVNPVTYDADRNNCGACGVQCPATGCGLLGLGPCACAQGTCQP